MIIDTSNLEVALATAKEEIRLQQEAVTLRQRLNEVRMRRQMHASQYQSFMGEISPGLPEERMQAVELFNIKKKLKEVSMEEEAILQALLSTEQSIRELSARTGWIPGLSAGWIGGLSGGFGGGGFGGFGDHPANSSGIK